jgi:hypothetical protein
MKKVFLILTGIIILILTGSVAAGCSSVAQVEPEVPEFMGSDFEITLPENWEGGTKEELESVAEKLEELGQEELAGKVEENKKLLLFFGYDKEAAARDESVSNLTITGEPAPFLSLDEYMELTYEDLSEKYEEAGYEFNIVEQEIVSPGNYEEIGRTLIEQEVEGADAGVAQYIIKHESDFWILTFTSDLENLYEDIEAFDKSIGTLKILD